MDTFTRAYTVSVTRQTPAIAIKMFGPVPWKTAITNKSARYTPHVLQVFGDLLSVHTVWKLLTATLNNFMLHQEWVSEWVYPDTHTHTSSRGYREFVSFFSTWQQLERACHTCYWQLHGTSGGLYFIQLLCFLIVIGKTEVIQRRCPHNSV